MKQAKGHAASTAQGVRSALDPDCADLTLRVVLARSLAAWPFACFTGGPQSPPPPSSVRAFLFAYLSSRALLPAPPCACFSSTPSPTRWAFSFLTSTSASPVALPLFSSTAFLLPATRFLRASAFGFPIFAPHSKPLHTPPATGSLSPTPPPPPAGLGGGWGAMGGGGGLGGGGGAATPSRHPAAKLPTNSSTSPAPRR